MNNSLKFDSTIISFNSKLRSNSYKLTTTEVENLRQKCDSNSVRCTRYTPFLQVLPQQTLKHRSLRHKRG